MGTYIFLIVLTIIICVLLALVVLVQNPKGGGLDASFGGVSNNTFGAKRTTDFLEKATWVLAVALVVMSISSALYIRSWRGDSTVQDIMNSQPSTQQQQQADPAQEGEGGFNLDDITAPEENSDNSGETNNNGTEPAPEE